MSYFSFFEHINCELNNLHEKGQKRCLRNINSHNGKYITINGESFLNLSSNDYLSLAFNTDLLNEFYASNSNNNSANGNMFFSSASSRLLTGNTEIYTTLESKLAKFYGLESALLFNSGYHANTGIIPAIAGKGDVIFSDKLNHASIIDGTKLSDADHFRYNHLNYNHLQALLEKHRDAYKNAIIISESVFSMDGDIADLNKLIELKNNYNCILYIDEAHAVGVRGILGKGICEELNIINDIDIITGTFGKAYSAIGAFILCKSVLKEFLINKCRSVIFSTSLPPIIISWISFILNNIPELNDKRTNLADASDQLRGYIIDKGIRTNGQSHIIPLITGSNESAVKAADFFAEYNILVLPIRPPSVPENTSRLRFSLTADINKNDLGLIFNVIDKNKNEIL